MEGIINKLKEEQMVITPEAKEKLNKEIDINDFINFLNEKEIIFVDKEVLKKYKNSGDEEKDSKDKIDKIEVKKNKKKKEKPEKKDKQEKAEVPNHLLEKYPKKDFKPLSSEFESDFKLLYDINGNSNSKGEIEDFLSCFKDRYDKISKILRSRLGGVIKAKHLRESNEDSTLIGIVNDIRESRKGIIIDLEDKTKRFRGFVSKKSDIYDKAKKVVEDEVIGVNGNPQSTDFMYINEITFPDLKMPENRETDKNGKEVHAALLSDLHFGSREFLDGAFEKFLDWINGTTDDELVEKIKYLVIAGDIVDGVGIYPEQEKDLLIKDIYKQYELAAEYLSLIPDHIEIIVSPGNHDATRRADPQTMLDKEIAEPIFDLDNVRNVGNPAMITLNGKKILIYHGGSLNPMANNIPSLSNDEPGQILVELLRKRHLNPIYGGYPLLPEEEDLLVIDEVPDIIHSGHVHVYEDYRYRDVLLVNSATWQTQTAFQKRMNLKPTPAKFPVVNLKDAKISKILDFKV